MDEYWRNTFKILMCTEICDGADAGICDGAPSTCSSELYYYRAFRRKKVWVCVWGGGWGVGVLICPSSVCPYARLYCHSTAARAARPFKLESRNFHRRKPYGCGLEEHIRNFDVTPGGRARWVAPKGPKSILYKHSHVAFQIKGNA